MALFGDSARFHEERNHCQKTSCFLKGQTPPHLGPGATYDVEAEDIRMGWKSRRPLKHQPMDSNTNRGESRGDTCITATITKDGHIVHKDSKKHSYPPTGQYDPVQIFSPTRQRGPNSPRPRPGEETYMGTTSPRLSDIRLHHGVIVSSSPRELKRQSSLGPGSYFTSDDTSTGWDGSTSGLLKKSYNRRVSGGNEQGYSIHSNPGTPRAGGSPRSAGGFSRGSKGRSKSANRARPSSSGGGRDRSPPGYFRQYTANTVKSIPSPVLLNTPPKRFGQHNYNYSDGKSHQHYEPHDDEDVEGYANNHARHLASAITNGENGDDNDRDPSTPYVVSPKRGIPIGRVYN